MQNNIQNEHANTSRRDVISAGAIAVVASLGLAGAASGEEPKPKPMLMFV